MHMCVYKPAEETQCQTDTHLLQTQEIKISNGATPIAIIIIFKNMKKSNFSVMICFVMFANLILMKLRIGARKIRMEQAEIEVELMCLRKPRDSKTDTICSRTKGLSL